MELLLKRIFKAETYTIGKLYIDGVYLCDTIEDKVRDLTIETKVYAKTAIPHGRYQIKLSRSPKFGRILPEIINVPQFTGIRIHRGNTAEDSAGCPIIGENKVKGKVINSTPYEVKLVKILSAATDEIWINIID